MSRVNPLAGLHPAAFRPSSPVCALTARGQEPEGPSASGPAPGSRPRRRLLMAGPTVVGESPSLSFPQDQQPRFPHRPTPYQGMLTWQSEVSSPICRQCPLNHAPRRWGLGVKLQSSAPGTLYRKQGLLGVPARSGHAVGPNALGLVTSEKGEVRTQPQHCACTKKWSCEDPGPRGCGRTRSEISGETSWKGLEACQHPRPL